MIHLPFNRPSLYFVRSSCSSVSETSTTSPFTRPFVPGDHAVGCPVIGNACGETACRWNFSLVHPHGNPLLAPLGSAGHGSSAVFSRPHSFIFATVHSPAFRMLGEPVSRGPYTSVR